MHIVPLEEDQFSEALSLTWDVFSEFEAPYYSPYGVESFKKFIALDSISELYSTGQMRFWGAFLGNQLVGTIALRGKNHISLLFVKKEFHRQGIARSLFHTLLTFSSSYEHLTHITVNSSPYAVEVYKKLGFIPLSSEQTVDGICFTPMKYIINDTEVD